MAKPFVTKEEFDKLPEVLRKEYKQEEGNDGRFMLIVEAQDGWALEDVAGLKSALSKKTQEAREAKAATAAEKARAEAAEADALELKKGGGDDKKKVDELVASKTRQIEEKYAAEVKARDQRIGQLQGLVQTHVLQATAAAAIAKHGGSPDLLGPHVMGRLRVEEVEDAGELRVVVLSQDRKTPQISLKQGSTAPMDADELVESMRKDKTFAPCFAGSQTQGGGSAPKGGASGAPKGPKADGATLSPVERLKQAHSKQDGNAA